MAKPKPVSEADLRVSMAALYAKGQILESHVRLLKAVIESCLRKTTDTSLSHERRLKAVAEMLGSAVDVTSGDHKETPDAEKH